MVACRRPAVETTLQKHPNDMVVRVGISVDCCWKEVSVNTHAVCCMLCVVCCMLCVVCCVLYAVCCMLSVSCCESHVVYSTLYVVYSTLYVV